MASNIKLGLEMFLILFFMAVLAFRAGIAQRIGERSTIILETAAGLAMAFGLFSVMVWGEVSSTTSWVRQLTEGLVVIQQGQTAVGTEWIGAAASRIDRWQPVWIGALAFGFGWVAATRIELARRKLRNLAKPPRTDTAPA